MTGCIKVGFTGSREGMTADQMVELRKRLSKGPGGTDWKMFSEFHHGDCVGADEQAHDMMRVLRTRYWPLRVDIVIHPPLEDRGFRAHCDAEMDPRELMSVKVLPAKNFLARDRDIVNDTDLLIGCPLGYDFRGKGGTSYTIRYALSQGKPVVIIWPDGTTTHYEMDRRKQDAARSSS